MSYALKVENISKQYENSSFFLKDVSFVIPNGTIMGLIGENGAGKTTTLGCILNTLKKDSGKILFFGKELSDEATIIREEIGVVYDEGNFPEYLTADKLENIVSDIYTKWDSQLFANYLKKLKLNSAKKLKHYSKGMLMKLSIAVALGHKPKLLILDEPTSGLDPIIRDELLEIFMEFIQDEEHSILLSSHITSDLEKIADYITFIHDGQTIFTEDKNTLIYKYGVLRCSIEQFSKIDKYEILSYRKKDHQIDVLVSQKRTWEDKYPNIIIDSPSIDEIMLLMMVV